MKKKNLVRLFFVILLLAPVFVFSQVQESSTITGTIRQFWEKIGNDIFNTNSGNVGIGTQTPQTKLEVNGSVRVQNTLEILGGEVDIGLGKIVYDTVSNIFDIKTLPAQLTPITFGTGGQERMRIDAGGNVGIGTSSPSTTLEVNGNLKTTGFEMPTGASSGKVLTSDAQGQGTWQDPPSSGGSGVPSGYSILGDTSTPPAGYVYTGDSIIIQNAVPGTWAIKTYMPTPRTELAVVELNGKIYTIGGNGGGNNANEEYDPATNTWTTKAPMPTPRYGLTVATVNNKVYAIGGSASSAYSINEEYDPATNTWTTKAPMPTAKYRLAASVVNNKIYVLGGIGAPATNDEFDPLVGYGVWSAKELLPTARWGLGAAVVNNRVYAIGGSGSTQKENEEYYPGDSNSTDIYYIHKKL